MPPKARKKLGYNWKARQSGHDGRSSCRVSVASRTRPGTSQPAEDTNALVLPSKPKKRIEEVVDRGSKRKRLNAKQRKRLMKVLEVKEKKDRRVEVLSHLSSLALPPSQLSHLLPSTSLSSTKHTLSYMASPQGEGVASVRGWRMRRKRRRRREVRAEKELRAPRKSFRTEAEISSEESGSASEEEEEGGGMREKGGVREEGGGEREEGGRILEESVKRAGGDGSITVAVKAHAEECTLRPPLPSEPTSSSQCVFVQLHRPVEVEDLLPITEVIVREMIVSLLDYMTSCDINCKYTESRCCLPVVGEEGRVMEAVRGGAVTVLCGETGSGKTTQLPQFLYEYGYTHPAGPCGGGMIAVTEPRRVAAVSMAHRVAYEMGLSQKKVSYQIRYEGNVSDETVIKFMTDGVLLKEIKQDFLLERYSVVVVDEAHERSMFTDILLGLLSRILPLRAKSNHPLKLIIMSATLKVDDFTSNPHLFPSTPPIISVSEVESRQFPVTVHFNKRTLRDYLRGAYEKVCKIHRSLPPGHVLVFVTGQQEVLRLCRLLNKTFPDSLEGEEEGARERVGSRGKGRRRRMNVNLDKYSVLPEIRILPAYEDEEEGEGEGEGEGENEAEEWETEVLVHDKQLPMLVLPLYSLLSSEQQSQVFRPVPDGVRLVVIATNIAETSITIPSVKYVVDTGKVKRRYYDRVTGISTFRVDWVSKASADQRAGRAGRTEAGHCYRLYSSAVFQNQFVQFSEPEICRRPVDDLVLQMKALGIEQVANFPFPTPPSAEALQAAEKTLQGLGALTSSSAGGGSITDLGLTMSQFPVAPRYAKMLALGHQHGCLPYVITLVAALSVKELFVDSAQRISENEQGKDRRHLAALRLSWVGKGEFHQLGDLSVLLRAVGAWDCARNREEFCHQNGLRPRAMAEVAKLRQQLTNTVNAVSSEVDLVIDPKLAPPTLDQARFLRQIVLCGLGDHVGRKIATSHMALEDKKRLRFSYQSMSCEDPVYLPPSSPFLAIPPQYVVYQELMETSSRIYMRGVTSVEEAWLSQMTPQFCTFSEPLQVPPPHFDPHSGTVRCHVICTYGPHCWTLPALEASHPPGLQRYRLFAMFLLQGKVIPQLVQFSAALLPPVTMIKSWAKLHCQTEVLLKALVDREVCSRHALLEHWRREPKYLLNAFSLWLPQSRHAELAAIWPPLDTQRHVTDS